MNTLINEMKLLLVKNQEKNKVTLKIYKPLSDTDGGDAYCTIRLEGFLNSEKKIYGVDEAHARVLAMDFLIALFIGFEIQSEDGEFLNMKEAFEIFRNNR